MTFNEDAEKFSAAARAFGNSIVQVLHIEALWDALCRAMLAFNRWLQAHL